MKTLDNILNTLKTYGIPCAFVRFAEPQETPYCILLMDQSANIHSDFALLAPVDTYTLELYYRDPQDRFDFEAYLSKTFVWQRYNTDVEVEDSVLMSAYDLMYIL